MLKPGIKLDMGSNFVVLWVVVCRLCRPQRRPDLVARRTHSISFWMWFIVNLFGFEALSEVPFNINYRLKLLALIFVWPWGLTRTVDSKRKRKKNTSQKRNHSVCWMVIFSLIRDVYLPRNKNYLPFVVGKANHFVFIICPTASLITPAGVE